MEEINYSFLELFPVNLMIPKDKITLIIPNSRLWKYLQWLIEYSILQVFIFPDTLNSNCEFNVRINRFEQY